MNIDFEKETKYLIKRVELAEQFHDGLTSHIFGRIDMYLGTDHLDFRRYVELANEIEIALVKKNWEHVAILVHAVSKKIE